MSKKMKVDNYLENNKEILFDLMTNAGYERLSVYFDGQHDDGQINDWELHPSTKHNDDFLNRVVHGAKIIEHSGWSNGQKSIKFKNDPTIKNMIDDIVYNVLEGSFGGWENDDGSCGEFVISAKKRKVELIMRQRYYEYDVSEHHF